MSRFHAEVSAVTCLETGETLPFEANAEGVLVTLPHPISGTELLAAAFRLS